MTAALISLSLVSAGNYYFDSEYSRENIKDAVRYMEQSDRANACIIAPKVGEVVEHYMAGRNSVYSLPSTAGTAADKIAEKLQGIIEQCADAWYVKARPRGDGFDNLVMNILEERYRIKREKEFAGVTLFYLDERDHR